MAAKLIRQIDMLSTLIKSIILGFSFLNYVFWFFFYLVSLISFTNYVWYILVLGFFYHTFCSFIYFRNSADFLVYLQFRLVIGWKRFGSLELVWEKGKIVISENSLVSAIFYCIYYFFWSHLIWANYPSHATYPPHPKYQPSLLTHPTLLIRSTHPNSKRILL